MTNKKSQQERRNRGVSTALFHKASPPPPFPVFLETGHLAHSGAVGLERQLGWGSQVALCKRLVSQVCLSLHLQCPPPTCHLPLLTASINSVLPASRILPKNYKTKQKQPSQVWDTGGWQIQASQTGRRRAPSSLSVPENLGISNDGKAWEMKTSPSQTMSTPREGRERRDSFWQGHVEQAEKSSMDSSSGELTFLEPSPSSIHRTLGSQRRPSDRIHCRISSFSVYRN